MLFIYNGTNLKLSLKSVKENGGTLLNLVDTEDTSKSAFLIKATDERVTALIDERYGEGRELVYNPSREYILLKDARILIDSNTDSYVVSEIKKDEKITRPKELIKNLLVLVIPKDDKFIINFSVLKKKPVIESLDDDSNVVILHLKTYNWSTLKEPVNVYIKKSDGTVTELELTSKEEENKNTGATYNKNVINVNEDYTGEVPIFAKKKETNYDKKTRNNGKGGYNQGFNMNSKNNKPKDLVIPKYEKHESRSQGGKKNRKGRR